ncbi:MAG TPA: response regulator [Candidatus Lokiarchaeia archaeon]|nr:response regulator [Candidatus Lokiarchaeia archaeon]
MSSNRKPSILVVDDDEGICETMADILGEMNFTVNTATDGYKALELVKTHEYSMTLMDMRMPGLDGLETLKQMRQVKPSMKVVMITAYAQDDTVGELKKVGVEAILSKPIKFTELFEYLPLNS